MHPGGYVRSGVRRGPIKSRPWSYEVALQLAIGVNSRARPAGTSSGKGNIGVRRISARRGIRPDLVRRPSLGQHGPVHAPVRLPRQGG